MGQNVLSAHRLSLNRAQQPRDHFPRKRMVGPPTPGHLGLNSAGPGNRACVSDFRLREEGRAECPGPTAGPGLRERETSLNGTATWKCFLRFPEMGKRAVKSIQLGSFRGHPMLSVPGTPTGPWPRGGEGVPTLSPPARAPGRRRPRSAGPQAPGSEP